MNRLAKIGTLFKKHYRLYSGEIVSVLQQKGFTDLRPSFLEVLITICELEGQSIKAVGESCGLKKQTMTSHLNELERRNYILRAINPRDKRQQLVNLTDLGMKFKISLNECINDFEKEYVNSIGELELERLEKILENSYEKMVLSRKSSLF
ncbi:MarR family transcriptional regulator [bacterium]|nr:MarR family transcriptional regulator [bacterium]